MLAEVFEAEVQDYLEAARGQRDEHDYALVVRNGYAKRREVICGAGTVEVKLLSQTTAGSARTVTG